MFLPGEGCISPHGICPLIQVDWLYFCSGSKDACVAGTADLSSYFVKLFVALIFGGNFTERNN